MTVKRWLYPFLAALLLCAGLYQVGRAHPTDLQTAVKNGDLVRIHILAHDDTDEQQNIKLHVRDAILEAFTPMLGGAATAKEAAGIVEDHLQDALSTAQAAAREMGFEGQVRVEFGVYDFPERIYGSQVVPAGRYQALRILLGDAQGRNWWCVMYPPLCFSGEDYEGEIRFESSIVKWIKKMKKEIWHAEDEEEVEPDAGDAVPVDADDAGSGGDGERLLGKPGGLG